MSARACRARFSAGVSRLVSTNDEDRCRCAAAPGNAAAARTLLAAGLRPVGFEIVVHEK